MFDTNKFVDTEIEDKIEKFISDTEEARRYIMNNLRRIIFSNALSEIIVSSVRTHKNGHITGSELVYKLQYKLGNNDVNYHNNLPKLVDLSKDYLIELTPNEECIEDFSHIRRIIKRVEVFPKTIMGSYSSRDDDEGDIGYITLFAGEGVTCEEVKEQIEKEGFVLKVGKVEESLIEDLNKLDLIEVEFKNSRNKIKKTEAIKDIDKLIEYIEEYKKDTEKKRDELKDTIRGKIFSYAKREILVTRVGSEFSHVEVDICFDAHNIKRSNKVTAWSLPQEVIKYLEYLGRVTEKDVLYDMNNRAYLSKRIELFPGLKTVRKDPFSDLRFNTGDRFSNNKKKYSYITVCKYLNSDVTVEEFKSLLTKKKFRLVSGVSLRGMLSNCEGLGLLTVN